MQNQENQETKKLTKQEYNRLYYQKNKQKWQEKKKEWPLGNVFHLFSKSALNPSPASVGQPSHWIVYLQWLEIVVLMTLVAIMTCFLVREAAHFYLDSQESPASAYLKAGMLEGIAILFSFSKSRHKSLRWAQKSVVVLLCGFTLWVMSGKIVKTAVGDTLKVQSMKQTLQQLESELAQKEQLRNQFMNKGWLTMTRRYEKGIDQLRDRLITTRKEIASLQTPEVIVNSLSILIAFRLLLVIANLVCIHRVIEQLGALLQSKGAHMIGKRLNLS